MTRRGRLDGDHRFRRGDSKPATKINPKKSGQSQSRLIDKQLPRDGKLKKKRAGRDPARSCIDTISPNFNHLDPTPHASECIQTRDLGDVVYRSAAVKVLEIDSLRNDQDQWPSNGVVALVPPSMCSTYLVSDYPKRRSP